MVRFASLAVGLVVFAGVFAPLLNVASQIMR
jgi:hypothetical protein